MVIHTIMLKLSILHIKAKQHNVDYMMICQSAQVEDDCRTRLIAAIKVIQYLLGQHLALHRHDESVLFIDRNNYFELIS